MLDKQLNIRTKHGILDLSTPTIMGIVNVTPDSFYKESRFNPDRHLLSTIEKMLSDGASIIDIGGYSTRPNAEIISIDDEIKRISKALELICKKFPYCIISLDTFRSTVVREIARNFPISIINDVSGGTLDNLMFETVADLDLSYVLMHMRGNPNTMQQLTEYDNIVSDMLFFFEKRIARLHLVGVKDIVIDLGFGFAKTTEQNFKLLKNMSIFQQLNCPILTGVSRKSMIYKTLNISADQALNGTTATNMLALMGGSSILRVHDVKEAMETITLFNNYLKS